MNYQFQILTILLLFTANIVFAQAPKEDTSLAKLTEKVIKKGTPIVTPTPPDPTKATLLKPKGIQTEASSTINDLRSQLEIDLSQIKSELSDEGIAYKKKRILKVRKEETEIDLLFISKLDQIKETIAYETLDHSKNYIKTAERFLDSLYHEDTEVSESFRSASQERYDNYVAQEKVIKVRINDIIVTQLDDLPDGDVFYKYSGFAILDNFPKKVRIEFYSDGNVSRSDPKWIFKVAAEDNISREVTIEGVIEEYSYGRKMEEDPLEEVVSIIVLKDWILEDRKKLIEEYKNSSSKKKSKGGF